MFDVKDLVIPSVTDKLLVVAKIKHSHAEAVSLSCKACTVGNCGTVVCAHCNCMAGLSEA